MFIESLAVHLCLFGDVERIEVSLEGFAIISNVESHRLIIQHAQANRPWLNKLLSRLVGKAVFIEKPIPALDRPTEFAFTATCRTNPHALLSA